MDALRLADQFLGEPGIRVELRRKRGQQLAVDLGLQGLGGACGNIGGEG